MFLLFVFVGENMAITHALLTVQSKARKETTEALTEDGGEAGLGSLTQYSYRAPRPVNTQSR